VFAGLSTHVLLYVSEPNYSRKLAADDFVAALSPAKYHTIQHSNKRSQYEQIRRQYIDRL